MEQQSPSVNVLSLLTLRYQQSILGFAALAVHVLQNTSWLLLKPLGVILCCVAS